MSDPIRDINKGHEDGADILRVSNVDGRNRTLAEQAWERIKLDADDGLKGTDYSADRVSGSKSSSHREHRTNRAEQEFIEAARDYARAGDRLHRMVMANAPRLADAVASRAAEALNRRSESLACSHCAANGHHCDAATTTTAAQKRADDSIAYELDAPMTLCRRCIDTIAAVHRLPTEEEAHKHTITGARVRYPASDVYRRNLAMAIQHTGTVMSERWKAS